MVLWMLFPKYFFKERFLPVTEEIKEKWQSNNHFQVRVLFSFHYLSCLPSDLLHCSDFKIFPAAVDKQETFRPVKEESFALVVQLSPGAALPWLLQAGTEQPARACSLMMDNFARLELG